jgi:L-lactate dehydrogenase complex protein LldG
MNKEEMLNRIRAAVGRTAPTIAPIPLPPFDVQPANLSQQNLIERFILELKGVGGHAMLVNSPEEIEAYVKSLLPLHKDSVVAISDNASTCEPWIRKCLESPTVRIVSPRDLVQAEELPNNYNNALIQADLGITSCDYAIADSGTLVLISSKEQQQMISLVPTVHLCLLDASQLVENLSELLQELQEYFKCKNGAPQRITLITGPSRTADIEQTVTIGVHGPTGLHVLLFVGRNRYTTVSQNVNNT